jgi:hypothetical protein
VPLKRRSLPDRSARTSIRRFTGVCEDVLVPLAFLTLLLYLVRRIRPTTIALAAYETWRRLPPEHRQQLILVARRNGPKLASSLLRLGRPRRG